MSNKDARKILTPADVAKEYGIPTNTQYIWKCHNRHGWADLVIKIGRSVRYYKDDIDAWFASRKQR